MLWYQMLCLSVWLIVFLTRLHCCDQSVADSAARCWHAWYLIKQRLMCGYSARGSHFERNVMNINVSSEIFEMKLAGRAPCRWTLRSLHGENVSGTDSMQHA